MFRIFSRAAFASALMLLASGAAHAGAGCSTIIFGAVLTAAQWNNCFSLKQDDLGYVPVNKAGDSMAGRLATTASSAARAGFAIFPGAAPTTPVDGDVWITASGMFVRVNGSTVGPLAGVPGASITFGSTSVALGGTLSAATARGSSGFNVESTHSTGDAAVAIAATTRTELTTATLTASRAWTLPAANGVNPGQSVIVSDAAGAINGANTIVVTRAGSDTINGATTVTMATPHQQMTLVSDGVSKWTFNSASVGTVTNATIAAGTGVAVTGTCAITTTGTCTVATNLSTASNSLGADVLLNNTATFFTGPSMAQGTSGTWWVAGHATLQDNAGVAAIICMLSDGTTNIASGTANISGAGIVITMSLSGFITSPAGNIRMSCRDVTSTSGKIIFNSSGFSNDSGISGVRIN